jgi:hypothetical protein
MLFPSGRRCFWRISFVVQVLSSVVVRLLPFRVFHHHDEVFVFFVSFFFISSSVVCILDVFGYLVGVEAVCNWYLCDINIYPNLLKNKTTPLHTFVGPCGKCVCEGG